MSSNLTMRSSQRRAFLGKLVAGAAALGFTSLVSPLQAKAAAINEGSSEADRWFNKVKGKHRIVFDATNHHDGFPLAWSRVFLATNNETGTADDDLGVVVILRHDAIALALEDRLWDKYKLGEVFKIQDSATKAASVRNMYWNPKPGELHFPDMSVDQLQKRGVMFCVCEMAVTVYSSIVAKNMKLEAADVKKDWLKGVLPGIQLVPSGVWAVSRAQEKGCGYCFAG